MISKKEIEKMPVLSAKAKGNDRFIGRIRMHGETIVMDVYDARRLMVPDNEEKDAEITFRWVCDKKNYYTYIFKTGTWTTQGMYCAAYGYSGYCISIDISLDKESREIAKSFLEGMKEIYHTKYADKLKELEEHIRQEKNERAWNQRRDRIEAREKQRKPLPKDWDRFLKNQVYKDNNYVFFETASRKIGRCAHCSTTIELDGKQKHNQMGKCPNCGAKVQYKATGRKKEMVERKQAIYLQKTDEGFLTRYIITFKKSTPDGEQYKSYDAVLGTYNGQKTWYDYCMVNGLSGNEYWDDNKPLNMNGWKATGFLYTKNAKKAVRGTVFRYAPLTMWTKHEKGEVPFADFMVKYQHSQFLEFFVKAGLFRLTKDYIGSQENWHGSRPEEILKVNRQRIKRLIQMDGGMIALGWLQYEEKDEKKIDDEIIKYLQQVSVSYENCKEIMEELGSVERMTNYMKKQTVLPSDLVHTWNDYLRMAKQEGYDTTDDIVRFPKDLRRRHDELVDLQEQRDDAKRLSQYADLDRKIRERLPEVKKFFWETKHYMIVPAGKCEELIKEGRTLHHCVGRDDNYMKRMAEGTSWICFLRKKENLEMPYYTLEIDMKTADIRQWYSAFDRKPDQKEISKLLEMYKKNIKKNIRTIEIQQQRVDIA